jgi:hypothetical protein
MAITIHTPDHSPAPTESPFPGYPIGVRPPVTSAVCANLSLEHLRHHECSLPACLCPCHATKNVEQEKTVTGSPVAA